MHVLSSVYCMNCTVYFYSWLLDIFSCHLIIKVSRGKFQVQVLLCFLYIISSSVKDSSVCFQPQGTNGKSQGKVRAALKFWRLKWFLIDLPSGFGPCIYYLLFYLCLCVLLGWFFSCYHFPCADRKPKSSSHFEYIVVRVGGDFILYLEISLWHVKCQAGIKYLQLWFVLLIHFVIFGLNKNNILKLSPCSHPW